MRPLSAFDAAIVTCIALVAGLEAAIEFQRLFPESGTIVSTTGWLRFAPFALLALGGCLWVCQLLLPPRRTIEILAPLEGETVPHMREVRGSIWPASEPVQVFVFTGREWRPQQLPVREGALWSAQCQFDASLAGSDMEFKIAAISRHSLIVGPVRRLPRWSTTTSSIVRVRQQA